MSWYIKVLKKYAVFTGRAHRTEFWMFVLFHTIFSAGLVFIDGDTGIVCLIYALAVLIPILAVSFRRLHDTCRSGWWMLIGLIPLVGMIVQIVFMVLDSQEGDNEYGSNPKAIPA